MYESLRPGAKQSASVADCIDPRNIIPRPLCLSVLFIPLRRQRPSPSLQSAPMPASPALISFQTTVCIIVPLSPPASAAFIPLPLQGTLKNRSDLASRSLLPFSGGCGGNRPTLLFVVPPTTFSYCDYET